MAEVMLLRALRVLLLTLLLAAVRPALALEPLPAGLEKDVNHLIEGAREFGTFTLARVRITALAVELKLTHGDEAAVIHLLPVDEPGFGEKVGVTKSFSAWLVSEPSPGALAAAKLALNHIAEKDDGTFYAKADALRGAQNQDKKELIQARALGKPDLVRRAITWLALIALLVWCAIRGPSKRDDLLWFASIGVLTIAAIVVRLKLPHWSPLHANSHGIAELRGLAVSGSTIGGYVETDRYGYAYRQIVRAFIGPWHGGYRAALAFGAVAGGLAVWPLMTFVSRLFRNRWSGLVAGLMLALHPAHAILSLSESPVPLALTLWLVSLWAVLAVQGAEGAQRTRLTWVAALALACASELSVPTIFLPAAALIALLLWRADRTVAQLHEWRWPALLVTLTTALHLYSLWPVLHDGLQLRGPVFRESLSHLLTTRPTNIAFDPTLSVRPLIALAVAGLITLIALRRFALALSLLALVVVPFIPAFSVAACRSDFIRYQTPAHLGLIALVAAVPLALARVTRTPVRIGLAAGLLALLTVPLKTAFKDMRMPSLEAKAFALAEAGLAKAGPEPTIRIAARRDGKVISDFPEYITQGPVTVEDSAGGTAGRCSVWLGPACYSFTDEEIASGMEKKAQQVGEAPVRAECHRLLEQIDAKAEPLAAEVVTVPHADQEFHRIPGKQLLIGLFPCAGSSAVATP